MLSAGPTAEEAAVVDEHFSYLKSLMASGVLIHAGRTTNTDTSVFGIVIFNAPDEQTAQHIMMSDPAVIKGVLTAALFPYRIALLAEQNA
jgi:uncharacterized protein YciI